MTKSAKKAISQVDFYAIEHLLWFAKQKNLELFQIRDQLVQITGEDTDSGHCMDACFEDRYTAKMLLERLGLKVEKGKK